MILQTLTYGEKFCDCIVGSFLIFEEVKFEGFVLVNDEKSYSVKADDGDGKKVKMEVLNEEMSIICVNESGRIAFESIIFLLGSGEEKEYLFYLSNNGNLKFSECEVVVKDARGIVEYILILSDGGIVKNDNFSFLNIEVNKELIKLSEGSGKGEFYGLSFENIHMTEIETGLILIGEDEVNVVFSHSSFVDCEVGYGCLIAVEKGIVDFCECLFSGISRSEGCGSVLNCLIEKEKKIIVRGCIVEYCNVTNFG
jgi:hypothetical protein